MARTRRARERRESTPGEPIRLNKFLAQNGVASRRQADQMILEGQVMVDGEIVKELGRRIDPDHHRVEVDGVVLRAAGERLRYYLLNKPSGVVCTNDPRETRPRAVDLVDDKRKGRIYTVGRLDEDTVGIVVLTNDGELANRVTHPRYGIQKAYRVSVRGKLEPETLEQLRRGVRLSDFTSAFSSVRVLKRSEKETIVLVELEEGRNREIRRVFAKLELPVQALRRVRIGPLTDRGLKVGRWRELTGGEVAALMGMEVAPRPRRRGTRAKGRGNDGSFERRGPWGPARAVRRGGRRR
jgi:23S rRNA pseudouridine2605 synthase